ncbi:potassium/proton antiporter [Nakamurella flavida]|uniref:Potassium/proton antiporter n=1 Tax=Nakamurella flavida TaxID=363630 RepID=A0A939C234_9ACTN|nr:potassium/proton antiporter [Nakamurella flavida]MBM9476100.1 potassium/proton antiporter [Nakamurella flavida]MDP9777155.1 cell volume regulation protein A [Nakamurella flavida]
MDLDTIERAFGFASLIIVLALVAVRLTRRLGLPSLLLFLGIGMFLGSDAVPGVEFTDTIATEQLGLAALVFILAEGGLTTRWDNVRPALGLGVALATVSVVVSIGVAGLGVHLLLGYDWRTSLLWGAVLSSTDAAAVFSVLRGVGVRRKLAAALELESGLNDAPVVIAVLLLAGTEEITWTAPLLVVYELFAGAVVGIAVGVAGAWALRRGALPAAGLYPLATIALIGGAYAGAQYAHASGFLAVYVAALVLGNSNLPHRSSTLSFAEALGWIAQIGLFVMLGIYVEAERLGQSLLIGVAIGLIVLLVARPLSVVAAALPFRLPWREQAFLSWSGLRGAVPIVLAMIPLMLGREHSVQLLDVIVVVVVIYTLLQGTSLPWVARKLGVIQGGQALELNLEAAPLEEMSAHVLQITIPPESRMHGVYLNQLRLPAPSVVSLILRAGEPVPIHPLVRLEVGDQLLVVAPERVRTATERRLRAVGRGGALANWFGEQGGTGSS